ncbi:MAG TPA: transposase [Pyrinomonadaceae bacterium]|jgi:transposase|nr:transposase [Pyrinomonadaceae bacterium]
MDAREQKALEIAAKSKLTRKGDTWTVPSQAGPKKYTVDPNPQEPSCTCPDFEARQLRCKHIFAVEYTIEREQTSDGQTIVTESVRVTQKTYTQDWRAYNKAQTNEKSQFLAFLYELCSKLEEPIQKRSRGRQPLPLADVLFTVTFKVYSTMSARRFQSDMRDALAKGYVSKLPSFNSIFDYLQNESLTPYLKYLIAESASPLKSIETAFATDSSGFSTTRFVRWFDVKYGGNEDWHDWIKMHLMCGVTTHIVTSVELSRARTHDSPYFKPLVEQTARAGFTMKEISADKGYISADNLQTAIDHGATPYIPFKTNVTGKRGTELWKRLFHFYSFNREEFLTHYHKRSNVETTFSMIKAKFGERLRSKTETAQINEALCKVLCHNLCVVIQSMYELGIEPEFTSEAA